MGEGNIGLNPEIRSGIDDLFEGVDFYSSRENAYLGKVCGNLWDKLQTSIRDEKGNLRDFCLPRDSADLAKVVGYTVLTGATGFGAIYEGLFRMAYAKLKKDSES